MTAPQDWTTLPDDLPVPLDDGAADHLPGTSVPDLAFPATDGTTVALRDLPAGRTVLYLYPRTGTPGADNPAEWDSIPGARGCTPEACGFRDHFADLQAAGATSVFGLSSQDTAFQREAVDRLRLPFAFLSDESFALAAALELPTFAAEGTRYYQRLTLVVRDGTIEHAFYPVFPPDAHADEVLAWLRG